MGAMNTGKRNPGNSRREGAPSALTRLMQRTNRKARGKVKSVMSDIWESVRPDRSRNKWQGKK